MPSTRSQTTIPAALEGLIKSLPEPGTPLSEPRRRQWLKMAEATLGFVYPESGEVHSVKEEEEGA